MPQKKLLPTPTINGNNNRKGSSRKAGDGLATAVKLWRTPNSSDGEGGPMIMQKDKRGYYKLRDQVQQINKTEQPLTSSPGVSLASLTQLQDSVRELVTNVTSGRSSGVSLAKLSPDGSWLRMCRDSFQPPLDGSFEVYSGTCPRWGTLLGGVLSELSTWERRTDVIGSLSWPTPTNRDYKDGQYCPNVDVNCLLGRAVWFATPQARDYRTGQGERFTSPARSRNLNDQMAQQNHPTPTASMRTAQDVEQARKDGKHKQKYSEIKVSGKLSVIFVEYLMGFPAGWSDLERSEMP